MTDSMELWDHDYEMDGLTESLLRELQQATLTDEAVFRLSVPDSVIALGVKVREEANERLSRGAIHLPAGDLSAFSQVIGWLARQRRAARQALKLGELSAHDLARSQQRVQSILEYAGNRGWIERDELAKGWVLTSQGLAFLARGGFNMR